MWMEPSMSVVSTNSFWQSFLFWSPVLLFILTKNHSLSPVNYFWKKKSTWCICTVINTTKYIATWARPVKPNVYSHCSYSINAAITFGVLRLPPAILQSFHYCLFLCVSAFNKFENTVHDSSPLVNCWSWILS